MDSNISDNKRELFKIYNTVNKEIYGYGVTELKVSCLEDLIIFRTRHNRVHTLQVLEENYGMLKQFVDHALFAEFKRVLQMKLEQELGVKVAGMLRDYDTNIRTAVTVVILSVEDGEEEKP